MSIPVHFKKLEMRNFLSFGNNTTIIELDAYGSTLIHGENVDANSNNGAGKTTIINAICYALYNKPFDNISLQRLINASNGLKNTLMEVRLFLTKGEDEYEIYRCRGETFNINVLCNGEDVTLDSVSENDKFVEEIIGMSYELFTKIIIFSGNSTPFLMLPVSQQRAQIEELFNITLLTEKAVILKDLIKRTESDINVQEAIIKQQEGAVKLYNKQLQDAEDRITRWESDREKQIASLKSALERGNLDLDFEKDLHELISSIKPQITGLNSELTVNKSKKATATATIKKLSGELEHLRDAKCPYCLQQYENTEAKIKELCGDGTEGSHGTLGTAYKDEEYRGQDVERISKQLDELNVSLQEAQSLTKFKNITEAVTAKASADTAEQRINELLVAENPHVEAFEALKKNTTGNIDYDVLNALKKDIDHQQFLLKLLTDKNSFIRRRIINKTIPFLNARLIHYTKELGLPHIVKFDDDMSCTVSEYGRELDFGNLSSGEKKRVNLSMSLAMRDVLHHLHSKVNCLFIDEIDASLDSSGVENVFRLLKTKTRDDGLGLWIISHRPEAVGRFDRNITVRKENGFSQIVEEEVA